MTIKMEVRVYSISMNTNILFAITQLHMRKTLPGSLAQTIPTQFIAVDPSSLLKPYTKIRLNIDVLMWRRLSSKNFYDINEY